MAIQNRTPVPPEVERGEVRVSALPAAGPTVWQLIVRAIVLVATIVAVVWIAREFSDLLLNVFMALLITAAIKPAIDRMDHVMPRVLALVLTCAFLFAVVLGIFALLTPIVIAETTHFSRTMPIVLLRLNELVPDFARQYVASLGQTLSFEQLLRQFAGQASALVGGVGGALERVLASAGTAAGNTLLVFVMVCFLLADPLLGPRAVGRLVPTAWQASAAELVQRLGRELGRWARAQLLVALLFGSSLGIGLWLLGIPYALSLGAAAALLVFFPYIGGLIVTVLALASAATISPWHVLGVMILNLTISLIEGHILYPKLVGDRVGLHPVIILVAFLVAVQLFGFVGVLLAVPLTIVLRVLYDRWVQPGTRRLEA